MYGNVELCVPFHSYHVSVLKSIKNSIFNFPQNCLQRNDNVWLASGIHLLLKRRKNKQFLFPFSSLAELTKFILNVHIDKKILVLLIYLPNKFIGFWNIGLTWPISLSVAIIFLCGIDRLINGIGLVTKDEKSFSYQSPRDALSLKANRIKFSSHKYLILYRPRMPKKSHFPQRKVKQRTNKIEDLKRKKQNIR